MRVTGGGGDWSGRNPSSGSRSAAFKNTHRPGQTVRGVVLRPEPISLSEREGSPSRMAHFAWLLMDGQELLANVGRPVATGEVMYFRIEALEPDIILRELRGQGQAWHARQGEHDGPGPAQLVPTFRMARDRFENQLALVQGWPETALKSRPDERQACFNRLLLADQALLQAYLNVLESELALDAHLAASSAGGLRFTYGPWLLPGFRDCELLVGRTGTSGEPATHGDQSLHEARLAFDCPGMGRGELRLLRKPPRAGYRIGLDSPRSARALSTALHACAKALAQDMSADFLGVFQLREPVGLGSLLDSDAIAARGYRV